MNGSAPMPPESSQPHFNWPLFLVVLLAPPIGTTLVVLGGVNAGDPAPMIALLGGGLAGCSCGIQLGRHIGKSTETKILLSLVFMAIMVVVCVAISCFGCAASGYQLNLH